MWGAAEPFAVGLGGAPSGRRCHGQPRSVHSWAFSLGQALLGAFAVTAAALPAIKPVAPELSIVGSLQAIVLFVFTISFLFTTPGVGEPAGGGFPAISLTGEFLLKDIPLLGLSFWTLADAIRAMRGSPTA